MLKRIIVPLDGTPFAEGAFAPAASLARAFGSSILVVRAFGPAGLPLTAPPDTEIESAELDAANDYLSTTVERLRQAGFTAEHVLYVAEPGTAIADVAALDDADLIVMTTHPRWRTDLLDNASTTLRVLARTRVPMLSWKAGAAPADGSMPEPLGEPLPFVGPETPIVVPLDGSPFSETALAMAQELAAAFGTYLVLVRAVAPAIEATTPTKMPTTADHLVYLGVRDAWSYLERVQTNMERTGVGVTIQVEVASVVRAVDTVVRRNNAGLIIMASHGVTAAPTTFVGSNTAQVLEELTVPVFVVRP